MLIEIGSAWGDVLLHGKKLEREELHSAVKELLAAICEQEFADAFCSRFGYDALPYSEYLHVDHVIDLDTHRVIKPKY